jgi:hypothetical protein
LSGHLAFGASAWLYVVGVILQGGIMAALSIPNGYFSFVVRRTPHSRWPRCPF